jgi:hypothetical protein
VEAVSTENAVIYAATTARQTEVLGIGLVGRDRAEQNGILQEQIRMLQRKLEAQGGVEPPPDIWTIIEAALSAGSGEP